MSLEIVIWAISPDSDDFRGNELRRPFELAQCSFALWLRSIVRTDVWVVKGEIAVRVSAVRTGADVDEQDVCVPSKGKEGGR